MTVNRRATRRTSKIGSDLEKVDAHTIAPEEYDEIPELTDEQLARAELRIGDKVVRRGRPPKGEGVKRPVTLRLAPDVLEPFKASGRGWQTRIEDTLRTALKEGFAAGLPRNTARARNMAATRTPVKSRATARRRGGA